MDNNNVNENLEVSTEMLDVAVEETEVLDPFVDTTNIVPVAPPVAIAPPVEAPTEVPTEVITEAPTEVMTEAPTVPPVENATVAQGGAIPTGIDNSEGAITIEAPLKEVDVTAVETGGNFKYILTIILFIVLGGTVIFMPEISEFVRVKQAEKEMDIAPKITTGDLKCTINKNSDNFDLEYVYRFRFKDNKLLKLYYTSITRGDSNLDEKELDELNNGCLLLKDYTRDLEGLTVGCELSAGEFTKEQSFDFSVMEVDSAYTAYSEAGGVFPEYKYLQDIDKIEKNMKAAGYTCERIK